MSQNTDFAMGLLRLSTVPTNRANHTVPTAPCQPIALADPIASMIVINEQDVRAAWAFTALYELVHLWLGYTGVSGPDTTSKLEQYCNAVAGEILFAATGLAGRL